jgi:hypothetical protein
LVFDTVARYGALISLVVSQDEACAVVWLVCFVAHRTAARDEAATARRDFDLEQRTADERREEETAEMAACLREAELAVYREKSKRDILERKWVQRQDAAARKQAQVSRVALWNSLPSHRMQRTVDGGALCRLRWVQPGPDACDDVAQLKSWVRLLLVCSRIAL